MATDLSGLAKSRGLTPDDIEDVLETYVPSGKHDEYLMFASGGHSVQALVIGLPSMRFAGEMGFEAVEQAGEVLLLNWTTIRRG